MHQTSKTSDPADPADPAAPRTSRQFWVESPGRGRIRAVELPPPRAGEVTVRTHVSGISRGSEGLVFRGQVPPSQYEAMRAPHQAGEFPGPVRYGYANVGRIEVPHGPPAETPADTTSPPGGERGSSPRDSSRPLEAGQAVFCLFGHQDVYRVPSEAIHPLPDGLPLDRAVLAANMETALNATWDGGAGPGDVVTVIGAGVVGLLVARLVRRIPGTTVLVVDPDPTREVVAEALDLAWSADLPDSMKGRSDLVFHASGHPEGLGDALAAAGQDSTVVEMSWYGDQSVPAPLGEAFHHRRLTLKSSQVGQLPPHRAPRWSRRRRMSVALELLLEDSALDVLLGPEATFDDLPEVMERLAGPGPGPLCHLVRYPTPTRTS